MPALKLVGLFTQVEGPGGVQRMARQMARGLARVAERQGAQCRMLSLVDPGGIRSKAAGQHEFVGFGRNRRHFSQQAFHAARGADLVYVNHAFISPVAMAGCFFSRKPYVVHLHGLEAWERLSFLRRQALTNAALVTTTSQDTARHAAAVQGVAAAKTRVLYPALDDAFNTEPAGTLPKGIRAPFALTVCRLAPEDRAKYIHEAVEAFARVAPRHPDWQYVIVGDGGMRADLQARAQQLGIGDRVLFTGRISDEELMACYAACELFMLPSLKEGLGIVFLEAMARGKATIGGNGGGSPEVVRHGETGWLVDPRDADGFAAALESALADEAARRRAGDAGRRLVESEFLTAHFLDRFESILGELLVGGRR